MKSAKQYYSTYLADDNIVSLNKQLADEVLSLNPNHVFELGIGTGKNLRLILKEQYRYALSSISVFGIDVSMINVINAVVKNNLKGVALADESYLRHFCNFDVVITCSCLDHIEDITGIIQELKRICNKAVIIAECVNYHSPENYYYLHDYESFGFEPIEGTEYLSEGDGQEYKIFKWMKPNEIQI